MESLIPLLEVLFTETNVEKRRQAEETLDKAGNSVPHNLIDRDKLFALLLQAIANPLNLEQKSS
jgi:hypothetical protein